MTIGNGLKVAVSHIYLLAISFLRIEESRKEFFTFLSQFNDSIIPYYAYTGSSFAYINATEAVSGKKRRRVEDFP